VRLLDLWTGRTCARTCRRRTCGIVSMCFFADMLCTGLGDVPGTTAAVLYDYVSEERDELSIIAGEV
jgi:hypothetical protein